MESLTSIAGVEEDAVKAWVEDGAVTGLEKDAVNVQLLQNLREVLDSIRYSWLISDSLSPLKSEEGILVQP